MKYSHHVLILRLKHEKVFDYYSFFNVQNVPVCNCSIQKLGILMSAGAVISMLAYGTVAPLTARVDERLVRARKIDLKLKSNLTYTVQ
jgi:hypothetical protein